MWRESFLFIIPLFGYNIHTVWLQTAILNAATFQFWHNLKGVVQTYGLGKDNSSLNDKNQLQFDLSWHDTTIEIFFTRWDFREARSFFFLYSFLTTFFIRSVLFILFLRRKSEKGQKIREPARTLAYGCEKLSPPPWWNGRHMTFKKSGSNSYRFESDWR